MYKKVFGLLILFSCGIFALPVVPTVLNNVQVKIFSGSGTNYSGRVTYFYSAGDNDSLTISLKIDPAAANSGAPACTITKAEGDVGIFPVVNCMNGRREIFFDCSFPAFPGSNLYVATVTILADQSYVEKTARAILAGIPNAQKCLMITGNGCFETGDATGVVAPSPYTTIAGFHMCGGPYGVNFRDPTNPKCATLFPVEAASANAFDTSLAYRLGRAIAEECKPSASWCGSYNIKNQNINLAPMLSMVRDPRGGRNYDTWGEDPFLMGKLAASDVRGRQSQGIICTPRNFVCNDEELNRERSSSDVDDTTLRQTYCYPFEMCLREAKPWSLIAAYNKLNGTYCTEDTTLLTIIAKQEWGFRGFIISDWFTWMTNPAIYSGLDIEMDENRVFGKICDGSVPQDIVDAKVLAQLRGKIWTGCVNDFSAFDALPLSYNSPDHVALADEGAHKSIVLVKNDSIIVGGVKQAPLLPLNKTLMTNVAVIGPYANQMRIGPGCAGTSSIVDPCTSQVVTPFKAIQDKIGASKVVSDWTSAGIVIVFVGVPSIGENSACEGQDRPDVVLPVSEDGTDQNALVQSILAAGKKTIVVLTGGSAVSQGAWSNASSIIVAFYPGQRQCSAIADVLFGDYNPSGRLSVTFPKAAADLPPFTAEGAATMKYQYERPNEGRGYPYYIFSNKVNRILFPFGLGLSYTEYRYSNLVVPSVVPIGSKVKVTVDVTNSGAMAGDHIVQLYMKQITGSGALSRPALQLRGFARVTLAAGETKTVAFDLREWDFAHWSKAEGWIVDPESTYELSVRHNSIETPPAGMTQMISMY
jgi:beta-glucosidase